MLVEGYLLLLTGQPEAAAPLRALLEQQCGSIVAGVRIAGVRCLQSLDGAIRLLHTEPGCVAVLLDLEPRDSALAALNVLHAQVENVPVLALVGHAAEEAGMQAVRTGASDYLRKSDLDAGGMLSRALHCVAQRRELEPALLQRALVDHATGLPRLPLLIDRLEVAMRRCARDGSSGALLLIDLHGSQEMGESLGCVAQAAALHAIAQRLAGLVRSSDSLARVGLDRFVVLLPKESSLLEAMAISEKLVGALREPVRLEGLEADFAIAIGVARFRDATQTPDLFLQRARNAMDRVGREAKGRVRLL
ncbi:MAG: diguanylate cyclase [Burkholderiaceae bacterium]